MGSYDETIKILPAEERDIPLAIELRKLLFEEMGVPDEVLIDNAYENIQRFYIDEFNKGRIRHFIAYNSCNEPVAIAGALLKNDFPYYLFKPGYYGWIIDVYTKPQYRGRKISTKLLQLTHDWLKEKGVNEAKLICAGREARILYEKLGYRPTWEMSLNISENRTYNEIIDQKISKSEI